MYIHLECAISCKGKNIVFLVQSYQSNIGFKIDVVLLIIFNVTTVFSCQSESQKIYIFLPTGLILFSLEYFDIYNIKAYGCRTRTRLVHLH